jgi:hypothetical protein
MSSYPLVSPVTSCTLMATLFFRLTGQAKAEAAEFAVGDVVDARVCQSSVGL